jgi:hypothetical protein
MSFRKTIFATAALSLAALASAGLARAADLPVKAKKPVTDLPFFLVIDDRISFSYQFTATDPGVFSVKPGGASFDGNTAKQVYNFTHFDIWGYGTNFFTISTIKSDHNDPANPCTNTGGFNSNVPGGGGFGSTFNPAACAGATEFYGLFRSTFGWNEIFGTKMFTMGPLHNISFEVGADVEGENNYLAPAKRDGVIGLQFAFDLPYKGYINFAPLAYKEINHNSFNQCGTAFAGGTIPGLTCNLDGNTNFRTTWALEINYYMDLGFLPENMQYFAISGRAGFYGPKGDANNLPFLSGVGVNSTATKTEINSEPIRLTFDASKALWGPKYAQFVTTWIAYRYWQNKFGLDHNAENGICNATLNGAIVSTHSCTEQTAYAGVTVKF